jgi:putative addiction module killer protein
VIEIIKTNHFDQWISKLRDGQARARINARLARVALGNIGDVKPVGKGVSEMRINYGPGYRVYCLQKGEVLVVLLCGGDKSSQQRDIENALAIAAEWKA